MSKSKSYDYLFKVVLIGDSGVGKTSLLQRYRTNEFSTDTKHTIGVEFATQEIEVEGKVVKIQIWDTAGQERYRAITKAYYRGALGAIVLYDLTDEQTFESLNKWLSEIRTNAVSDIKIMLVGNKKDLEEKRAISVERATNFAKKQSLAFLEASAKSGDLVVQCFETVVRQIFAEQQKQESNGVVNGSVSNKSSIKSIPQGKVLELDDSTDKSNHSKTNCCQTS